MSWNGASSGSTSGIVTALLANATRPAASAYVESRVQAGSARSRRDRTISPMRWS
jgi:hypothetical protein